MKRAPAILFLSLLAIPAAGHAQASPVPAGYYAAAAEARVGPSLFYAIALTESGQSTMTAEYRPWPWSLSIDHKPHFFPTREAAFSSFIREVEHMADSGIRKQLGVGLFQIEYRYHSHRFESPGQMLDPYANARVAAEIFSEGLTAAGGDVWEAVGLFHSNTPQLAQAYQQRVAKRLVGLAGRAE